MPIDGCPGGGGAYLFPAISHQGATKEWYFGAPKQTPAREKIRGMNAFVIRTLLTHSSRDKTQFRVNSVSFVSCLLQSGLCHKAWAPSKQKKERERARAVTQRAPFAFPDYGWPSNQSGWCYGRWLWRSTAPWCVSGWVSLERLSTVCLLAQCFRLALAHKEADARAPAELNSASSLLHLAQRDAANRGGTRCATWLRRNRAGSGASTSGMDARRKQGGKSAWSGNADYGLYTPFFFFNWDNEKETSTNIFKSGLMC